MVPTRPCAHPPTARTQGPLYEHRREAAGGPGAGCRRLAISLIWYLLVSDAGRIDTRNLGFLLAKASQHWNELLAAGFAERGFGEVRPSYGSVLLPLFEQEGLRMGQIAERARLSKQTITTIVRLCERDGLVYRERDTDDARAFRIHLTERARSFRPIAREILRELDSKVLAALGARQRSALTRALKGVMEL
jgi:DNA-binding MarR family transcriptional regulator